MVDAGDIGDRGRPAKQEALQLVAAEKRKLAAGVREAELTEAGYALVERFDTHAYHDFEIWRARHPWEK